jgi:urease accessory protein
MHLRRFFSLALLTVTFAAVAHAHPGHDGHELTWDFSGGVLHPLSGWDHLLAMISVGLWAALLGGRARWIIPAAFVATMMATAMLAPHGPVPSLIEQGIAVSILGLGLLIAFGVRLPIFFGIILITLFAAFHGWAHGAELPEHTSGLFYGAGFVLSTIFLHGIGIGLGYSAQHYPRALRAAGATVAICGLLAVVQ